MLPGDVSRLLITVYINIGNNGSFHIKRLISIFIGERNYRIICNEIYNDSCACKDNYSLHIDTLYQNRDSFKKILERIDEISLFEHFVYLKIYNVDTLKPRKFELRFFEMLANSK